MLIMFYIGEREIELFAPHCLGEEEVRNHIAGLGGTVMRLFIEEQAFDPSEMLVDVRGIAPDTLIESFAELVSTPRAGERRNRK